MLLFLATFLLLTGMATAANKIRLATPVIQNPLVVGDSIEIPVMITTDTLLGAFTLGFKWDNPYLKVTSTNLDNWPGTAMQLGGWQEMFFGGDTSMVLIGWIDLSGSRPLKKLTTERELCRLNVVVQPGATWSCANFDSSFIPPAAPFIFVPKVGVKFPPAYADNGDVDVIIGGTECPTGPSNTAPNAICHDVTVFADNTCHAAASIDNGSNDPDAGDVITLTQNPAGPYPLGNTLVTLIVTDNGGLADTCQATVHVLDNTPPTITCPGNIVKGNDAGQCGAIATFSVTATDFCTASPTIAVTPASGSFFPIGLTNVTAIATDGAGNADTCTFSVTVNDTEKPVPVCPGNFVVNNAAGQCGAVVEYGVSATDNCPGVSAGPSIPSGTFFPVGTTKVWMLAADAAGNKDSCSFTVTVNDVDPPIAQCNGNVVKDNDPGQCGAVATFTFSATDHCPGVTVVAVPPSGSFFPIGATQVAVIATDGAGLKDTCFFDVTVKDVQKPVITCPTNIVVSVNPGETSKVVEFAPVVTDNCPGVIVVATPPSGSTFPLGVTTVKVAATDAHGLKDSCEFTVEVKVGLVPDFAVDANPDTLYATAGIPDSLMYFVDLTAIDGYNGSVSLSVSTLPTGVVLDFGTNPLGVPGSTTLAGHTSAATPAGAYELTITASAVPTRMAHTTTVWLIINPCTEPPVPAVSQNVFNIEITEGENVASDSVFVRNNAPCGIFYWYASSDQPWVTPDPNLGSVNAGDNFGSVMHLNYNLAALAPNTYVAHVMVTEDKKKVVGAEITINLTVNPKPPSMDSISVVDANVYAGGTVGVPVRFLNNEPISGMSAGLHWNSSDVTLDSVSYVGSRIDYVGAKFANIENGDRTVALGAVVIPPEALVLPGDGLWATLWFTAGMNCPATVMIDSQFIAPGVEMIFTDSLAHIINPQFAGAAIQIDCQLPNCISGVVQDVAHLPIVGATVELYAGYPPAGMPVETTVSDANGNYEFCADIPDRSVYSVRAQKAGYYPAFAQAYLPTTDLVLTLIPISGVVTPTYEWVNLYCDLNALFEGAPVLPGSVIEAFDPQGVLCGRWTVTQPGTYGFMPVYRDDQYTPSIDEGCEPGNLITVKVDGFVATIDGGPLHWGTNGDRYHACFDVTPVPPSHCLILKQGWNLVSWNVDTPNDSIMVLAKDVMDNVDVILSFEMGAQTYDPMLPEFSTLLYADHYHGFWFRMNAEDTLCVEGPVVASSTPIDLENNWNLVSYLPMDPLAVPTALASIFDKVVVVLGYDMGALTYDPAYPMFNNLNEMKRDFGYWIKTTQAATLVYPGPIFAKATPTVQKSEFTPRTSQSNTWVNLYGSDVKLNGQTLPVGAVIEAFDASNNLIGESVVRTAGKFGFMPVYGAEAISGDMVSKSAGSAITLKVNGEAVEQSVTWTENGDRIRVDNLTTVGKNNGNLPTSFSLNQNYPNPFNPETTIEYVVAQGAHVELAVYNILGDKIKTLVSGYQAAGSYIVKWQADTDNGSTVASGVYFYKLTAGDYTDTKKMTLLK